MISAMGSPGYYNRDQVKEHAHHNFQAAFAYVFQSKFFRTSAAHLNSICKHSLFLWDLLVDLFSNSFTVSIRHHTDRRDSGDDHCQDDTDHADAQIKRRENICDSHGIRNHQAKWNGHKGKVCHNVTGFSFCVKASHVLLSGKDYRCIGCTEPGCDQVYGRSSRYMEQGGAYHRLGDHTEKLP